MHLSHTLLTCPACYTQMTPLSSPLACTAVSSPSLLWCSSQTGTSRSLQAPGMQSTCRWAASKSFGHKNFCARCRLVP